MKLSIFYSTQVALIFLILGLVSCQENPTLQESLFDSVNPAESGNNGRDSKTIIIDVTNPKTGKAWMDRNLGAKRAATSSYDTEAYGDLYQWGRGIDGHQKRNSSTVMKTSKLNKPGHNKFILNSCCTFDWRDPQINTLWQGLNGTNNPCPLGYRIPSEIEWNNERQTWGSNNLNGAFTSTLKLAVGGQRDNNSGLLYSVGNSGSYWSSTIDGENTKGLAIGTTNSSIISYRRGRGLSVRCIKDS